ncbi:MAG: DUF1015 domain-containing protein [Candidatus Omnitrophica bacterium]|nr:DUF1015 domain-containing protein [Candidatus Omnitrophota bacterium]
MAKIKPFQAVIYNQEKIKDLSKVVCPPYDVISAKQQDYYHGLSEYNFIHILLGKDISGEDKYERSADYFKGWLKNNILIRDRKPAVYFYSQDYKVRGENKTRLGFITLLRLEEENSAIFRHEHTRLAPKEDRFNLMKQVKANLSPIFVIFSDKKRIIQRVWQKDLQGQKPFIEVTDQDKVTHRLWRIESDDVLSYMQAGMAEENIFIADGHHRYEVACAYRAMMLKEGPGKPQEEEDFNYVLTYFTNTDARGLSILPFHRLVRLQQGLDIEDLKLKLKDDFDLEEIKDKSRFFFLMEKGGRSEHVLGMYKDKRYWLLRLKNVRILDKMVPDKPKEYRSLDAVILNYLVLKKVLAFGEQDNQNITYGPFPDEFIEKVDNDPFSIAFFLNPVRIEQIMAVAEKGERMPPKSTYFYPKVLSGLVINKFDSAI